MMPNALKEAEEQCVIFDYESSSKVHFHPKSLQQLKSISMPPSTRQHGVKGVYHAGEWLDLEDCDEVFTNIEDKCSGCNTKGKCPRSRSRPNASSLSSKGTNYDVAIIGAGCVGAAIARELAKYQLDVLWLEAADDVSQGATKGNSGIVHAGFDDEPGTNRSKFCWPGNQMFPDLDKDLKFGYQKNGSLVLATSKDEVNILKDLLKRGETNGVKNLRILEKEELFKMEPHVNPDAVAALYAPDAGNVIPYVSLFSCVSDDILAICTSLKLKSSFFTNRNLPLHWRKML